MNRRVKILEKYVKMKLKLLIFLLMTLAFVVSCNNIFDTASTCIKCSDLKEEITCRYNRCDLNCNWKDNNCVDTKKPEVKGILSGEVTWIDDSYGPKTKPAYADIIVFPLSDLRVFIESLKVKKQKSGEYFPEVIYRNLEKKDVLPSYKFENSDTLGKYQVELEVGKYVICFGSKFPNKTDFETFYPNSCYQFEIRNEGAIINYGGDRQKSADCKNIICREIKIQYVEKIEYEEF